MEEMFKLICPVCGKQFYSYMSEHWAYKVTDPEHPSRGRTKRVCSWGCLRKWERERSEQNVKQRKKENTQ